MKKKSSFILTIFLFLIGLLLLSCSGLNYFFATKLKISAGSPVINTYISDSSKEQLEKLIQLKVKDGELKSISPSSISMLTGIRDSTYLEPGSMFFYNKSKSIIFYTFVWDNGLNKSTIALKRVIILPDNKFVYSFDTYKEKKFIRDEFKNSVLRIITI